VTQKEKRDIKGSSRWGGGGGVFGGGGREEISELRRSSKVETGKGGNSLLWIRWGGFKNAFEGIKKKKSGRI